MMTSPITGQAGGGLRPAPAGVSEAVRSAIATARLFECVVSRDGLGPRYERGDTFIIAEGVAPTEGRDVLVELRDGLALLRRFVRANHTSLTLAKWDGSPHMVIPRSDVKATHHVVRLVDCLAVRP